LIVVCRELRRFGRRDANEGRKGARCHERLPVAGSALMPLCDKARPQADLAEFYAWPVI
jgi:hypothetical protein